MTRPRPSLCCLLAAAAALAMLAASPAEAQQHPGDFHGGQGHYEGRAEHGYRDRHPGHFAEHDWGVWRGGAWRHEWHDGRFGWWWLVGPDWYYYPEPLYPYPNPYVPPTVEAAPAVAGEGPPPAQYWYYCDNPPGYYPYVATCQTQWRPVPATPQAPGPQAPSQ